MTPVAVKEHKLGKPSGALRRRLSKTVPDDLAFIDCDIEKAPVKYRKSVTSVLSEDVFKRIDPQFPLLLQKTNEHRMDFRQLLGELELVLGMGSIHDPDSSVYIYSLQVIDPLDITGRIDTRAIEAFAPREALIELRNGYIRHELLYDVPDFHSKILLVSLLRCAKKVRISLKPPWAAHKVQSTVELS